MFKRLFLIILIVLWASTAWAETFYVRPSSDINNNGDGLAYTEAVDDSGTQPGAWKGWSAIQWGDGDNKVGPGDTLMFCGIWIYGTDFNQFELQMPTGGTDDNNRITIDFTYEPDPGIIAGARKVTNYNNEGNGIYSFTYPGGGMLAYGDDPTTAVQWHISESFPPSDGEYYYDDGNNKYFINPPGNEEPQASWYNWNGTFMIDGYDYITLNGIKSYFSSSSVWSMIELGDKDGSGREPEGITITGGTLHYAGSKTIGCYYANSNDIEISYCDFKYFKQVTYPFYGVSPTVYNHTYWHIHHNTVDGDTQAERTSATDGHVFGGQNISYSTFEHNIIVGCEGDAFLNYTGSSLQSFGRYNTFRYNFIIYDPDAGTLGLYGRAFDFNGSVYPNGDSMDERTEGGKVYENIVVGAPIGVRIKGGYSSNEVWHEINNNTFIGCGTTFYFMSSGAASLGGKIRNNISLSPTDYHIYSVVNLSTPNFLSDYNIYYPDGAKFHMNIWTSTDLEHWVQDRQSLGIDENSISADPILNGAGTYDEDTDIKFPSNSPAKDNGTYVGLSVDYFGTPLPQGGGYDIGAHEYVYPDQDTDGDSMPDYWELLHGLDPQVDDADLDPDEDGLTNLEEYQNNTDPHKLDTDDDGMPDGWEVEYELDPTVDDAAQDLDGDGLTNFEEYQNYNTYPNNSDSDGDGMPDGWEVQYSLNPLVNDAYEDFDGDGFVNLREYLKGTDPTDPTSKPTPVTMEPILRLLLN